MILAYIILALVALQRLAELAIARRNTARLLGEGAVEIGADHFKLLVLLHAGWLLAILLAIGPETTIALPLLAFYLVLQIGRAWTMASLGRYWTTRIISLPDAPLVRRGPYRFLRHPNYLVVALEIPTLPLMLHMIWIALAFGIANLALLAYRIRVEDSALLARRTA